jgi:L-ascorbate metabolism protein UlaG (beta-lactamase superfamily)
MAEDKVTFIGNSTLLIEANGKKILTDPWFHGPVYGGIDHRKPPGIPLEDLSDVDAILVTHNHKDHYDKQAMEQLNKNALVVLPEDKMVNKVKGLGYSNVKTIKPWQEITEENISINAVPAKHPAYQVGYIIKGEETTFYFAGDTLSIPEFSSMAERFNIDVALLPIGGLKMFFIKPSVMGPEDAARAAKTLKAKVLIPIHYDLNIKSMAKLMVSQTSGSLDKLKEAMQDIKCEAELVILDEGNSYPS